MKRVDLKNQKFGNLTIIASSDYKSKCGDYYWLCKCDCGKEKLILGRSLITGKSKSCGCRKKRRSSCAWDANTEQDLAGYYLYWRTPTGTFQDVNRTPVVKSTTPTFSLLILNLSPGQYVIAVSAYNTAGNESGMSNEVTWDADYPGNPKNALVK